MPVNKGGFKTKISKVSPEVSPVVNVKIEQVEDKIPEQQNIVPEKLKRSKKKDVTPYYLQYNGTPLYPMKDDQTHMSKRYVLFIGNLPYDITKEQLEEHFRKTSEYFIQGNGQSL